MIRLFLSTILVSGLVFGQTAAPAARRILGEVTAVDAAGGKFTVKVDKGDAQVVEKAADLQFKRVPPGVTDLKKAEVSKLDELEVGDRVLVRDKDVVVMAKHELAKKHEADREEWTKRGTSGLVTVVSPATKEITMEVKAGMGPAKLVVLAITEKTQFRRYAPDSVKFSEAKDASLKDLTKGDQLRVLGTKSEDGSKVDAEMVVFGTFRTMAGTITKVDSANGTIELKPLEGKPVTIRTTKDSTVKKMPEMMARMMGGGGMAGGGMRPGGGAPGAPGGNMSHPGGQARGPEGRPVGAPGGGGPEGAGGGRPGGGPGGFPGGAAGMGRGGAPDINAILERMPSLPLTDLKTGDQILVSSTKGAAADQMTAITILTGVEALLAARPAAAPQGGRGGGGGMGTWTMDIPVL